MIRKNLFMLLGTIALHYSCNKDRGILTPETAIKTPVETVYRTNPANFLITNSTQNIGLDINNDGVADVYFITYNSKITNYDVALYGIKPAVNVEILCSDPGIWAYSFNKGQLANNHTTALENRWSNDFATVLEVKVGKHGISRQGIMFYDPGNYVGLRITINGKKHLAWIRMVFKDFTDGADQFKIVETCFNHLPDQEITTGS